MAEAKLEKEYDAKHGKGSFRKIDAHMMQEYAKIGKFKRFLWYIEDNLAKIIFICCIIVTFLFMVYTVWNRVHSGMPIDKRWIIELLKMSGIILCFAFFWGCIVYYFIAEHSD